MKRTEFTKWCLLIVLLIIPVRLANLGNPLLDHHSFRQTQTAISAYWMAEEGITLPDYPLPVLGRPWSAPFEFPVLQLVIAGAYKSGIPLDLAARATAVIAFTLAIGLLALLLRSLQLPTPATVAFIALAAFSPFALVWSRACLIDFTSVLFSIGYLALCIYASRKGWGWRGAFLTIAMGGLAAATKVTTLPVYWAGAAAVGLEQLWNLWRQPATSNQSRLRAILIASGFWAAILIMPLVIAGIWTHLADGVKQASPSTRWLTSEALGGWNFGDTSQRFKMEKWSIIYSRITSLIVPFTWPLVILGVLGIARLPRSLAVVVAGLFAGSLATVLLFFSLYTVHDYYLCAVAAPIWLLAALGANELARLYSSCPWKAFATCTPVVMIALAAFKSNYVAFSYQDLRGEETIKIAELVKKNTRPEDEIFILGDDWNSRIPYYSRRKALMIKEPFISYEYAINYAERHSVKYAVVNKKSLQSAQQAWPGSNSIARTDQYTLLAISPVR